MNTRKCKILGLALAVSTVVKVHLTSKYYFRLNKSSHLFERHCTFLN